MSLFGGAPAAEAACPLCGEPLPPPERAANGADIDAAGDHLRRHGVGDWFPALVEARLHMNVAHQADAVAADLGRIIGTLLDHIGVSEMVVDRRLVGQRTPATVWLFEHAPDTVVVRA